MAAADIRVLHVDDDPSITELSAAILERAGDITVTTTTDPESVPERFERGAFDCIVSDYEMPGLDGLELFDRLEPAFDHDDFPFILFTGRGSEEVAADALNAGVTGYLQKGGKEQYERLANRIRNAAKQYRAQVKAERYETVLGALGYPVYVVDETGTFRFVNGPFADLTGYDREEILGERTGFVKPETTVERAETELGRLLSDSGPEVARFEATIETADGDHVRCRDHMGVLPYEGEQFRGSVGILRVLDREDADVEGKRDVGEGVPDTGDGRDTESELDGGRRLDDGESLFETLPDPTLLVAVGDDTPRVVRVNEAFETVFGCDAETVAGQSVCAVLQSLPADGRTPVADALTAGTATSRVVSYETADGDRREFLFRTVPVDNDGDDRVYGVCTDITARVAYESNLTALHETARELMTAETAEEVVDIGVEATRDILGHELTSIHFCEDGVLVPAVTTDGATALLDELPSFAPGNSIAWRAFETGEVVVRDAVGEDPDVLNPDTAFRAEMILPLGSRGVLLAASTDRADFSESDVSLGRVLAANIQSALAKVDREGELREREASLVRQNERLDEFASIVSHDLRTPLDLAGVHLELAAEECAPNDHLEKVADAHARMADLIDDVLMWAREGDAVEATEHVSIPALLRECWAGQQTGDATLDVTTDRSVQADHGRLTQVFDNLFDNAIAYAGETATVTVGETETGDGIYVADDGPGIPPAERDAVFDSGHTLSMEGTGFGLAIVRQIVEAHGWSVTLTESEDGGARFEIRF